MRLFMLSLWLCLSSSEGFLMQQQMIMGNVAVQPECCYSDVSEDQDITSVANPKAAHIFRRIEEKDISKLVRMYVREYGPSNPNQQFTLFPRKILNEQKKLREAADFCDNFILAFILYLGLYQRIKRRLITEPDHQVWCLATADDDLVGALELSLEPFGQTASPFCVPVEVKELFARKESKLQPYVSNVIVKESFRGRGFGSTLVEEVEQEAVNLGYNTLTLHVDINSEVARSLYQKMGYDSLDTGTGPDIVGRLVRFLAGLYFIEDTELLYMRKELKQISGRRG